MCAAVRTVCRCRARVGNIPRAGATHTRWRAEFAALLSISARSSSQQAAAMAMLSLSATVSLSVAHFLFYIRLLYYVTEAHASGVQRGGIFVVHLALPSLQQLFLTTEQLAGFAYVCVAQYSRHENNKSFAYTSTFPHTCLPLCSAWRCGAGGRRRFRRALLPRVFQRRTAAGVGRCRRPRRHVGGRDSRRARGRCLLYSPRRVTEGKGWGRAGCTYVGLSLRR